VAKAAAIRFAAMIVLATGSANAGPAGAFPIPSPAKPQLLVVTEMHPAVIDVSSYPDAASCQAAGKAITKQLQAIAADWRGWCSAA